MDRHSVELKINETDRLITPLPDPQWRTSDGSVVSVEDGTVRGLRPGKAVVSAVSGEVCDEAEVTVVASGFGFDDDILISIFWPPTPEYVNDEQFRYMADAGVNWVLGAGDGTGEKENQLKMLELCYKYGIGMCVGDDRFGGNLLSLDREQIKSLVDEYRNVPGAYGYYMLDEPMNPNTFLEAYKSLKAADPEGYMHLNFLPASVYPSAKAYESQMNDWLKLCAMAGYPQEYLMHDHYPFPLEPGTVSMDTLLKNLECSRRAGLRNNVKTAMYVQAVCQQVAFRSPNRSETLFEFNLGLAFGIKQFSYFTWFTPHDRSEPFDDGIISRYGVPNPKYHGFICEIGAMIHRIGKTLIHLDSVKVYETKDGYGVLGLLPEDSFVSVNGDLTVSYMTDRRDGRCFCMIVNNLINDPQEVSARFAFDSGLEYLSYGDGALHGIDGGKVDVTLEAGGALIVALPAGYVYPPDGEKHENLARDAEVYCTSSAGERGFYMDNLNDGYRYTGKYRRGWRSASKDGLDDITVDLKACKGFDRVDLYPVVFEGVFGEHMFTGFTLEYSGDGQSYTRICSASGLNVYNNTPVSLKFPRVSGRYLRLRITECRDCVSELGQIEIYDGGDVPEPEIYVERIPVRRGEAPEVGYEAGVDLALRKKVITSSSPAGESFAAWGWAPEFLTDGVHERGWTSDMNLHKTEDGVEFATVDLGDTFFIESVKVFPRECWPVDFDVSVSTDNETFETVVTERNSDTPETFYETRVGARGRYVRFRATKLRTNGNDGYLLRLSGIEVYGSPFVDRQEALGYIGEYLNHGGDGEKLTELYALLDDPGSTQNSVDRALVPLLRSVGLDLPYDAVEIPERAEYKIDL